MHYKTFVFVQCCSQTGLPFYINKPSTTLIKCLGNPTIARMLKQYPEKPEAAMKYVYTCTAFSWNEMCSL